MDLLRQRCLEAVRVLRAVDAERVLVLGPGPVSAVHPPLSRGTFAAYGVPVEVNLGAPGCGGALDLPLSLSVAATLLADSVGARSAAIGYQVGLGFSASAAAADLVGVVQQFRCALLVMGDGSARRSESAPGYLDVRA